MENGEKQNTDNEGKSQNVVPVQSTGDKEILRVAKSELRNQIILRCSHPNSTEYVDFRVEPMMNGHFYNLIYDSCHYIVHKHNLEMNHVLTHKKYEKTLQQWLDENDDNWCETYRDWGVNRPKEDARKIILGILNAVYKLHQNESFHGFLHHPENFAMDSDDLVIGGVHKEIIHISLIHANEKCNQFDRLSGDGNPQVGMKNDIQAMSKVIFNDILRWDDTTSYPKDLQHLYSLLHVDGDSFDWKSIVNHPSLWHWKSRFSYIGSVWAYYKHGDETTQRIMDAEFSNINVCESWKNSVLSNSVLGSIYKYAGNYYGQNTKDLLRYLRNARFHYIDYYYDDRRRKRYRHIKEEKDYAYLDEQFIELKTTGIDELFLVELYPKMRDLGRTF